MNIYIDPLSAFYVSGAIALLAVAIIVYPTLRYGAKKKTHKRTSVT